MKDFIKSLRGSKTRLTHPPHPMEFERMKALAEAARRAWEKGGAERGADGSGACASPQELEDLGRRATGLIDGETRANAIKVRRELGWQIVAGYALLELAQGCSRSDPITQAFYHGEPHWWNVTPKGLWVGSGHFHLVIRRGYF